MTTSSPHTALRVVVAGGGPVGLVAANLLAEYGVDVVLIERNATTSNEAKAISMDAESVRVMHMSGLSERIDDVIAPGTGVRFYGCGNRRIFQARGPKPYILGYPIKSQFSQPELERVLFERLGERPNVEIRMSTELVDIDQDAAGTTVTVRPAAGGDTDSVRADYVLACDGGRSSVRTLCGITMSGNSFDDVWLVVDTIGDEHDDRCSMHHGDPGRPHVIVPGGQGRCRYEFLLRDGEGAAGDTPPFELIRRLLEPYRTITPEQVERSVNYRFHGIVADRWRQGRVLLLGDAAHMMPPFAGQGLNSGIRDAANLSWKLAELSRGRADERILDTYESERKPHAEATVKASVRQGRIVMTTNRAAAVVRDVAATALLRFPATRRYLVHLEYLPRPRFGAGVVVPGGGLVGGALDQPYVQFSNGNRTRLDTVLGSGWTLLGVDVSESEWSAVAPTVAELDAHEVAVVLGDRRPRDNPARTTVGDADGELEELLSGVSGRFVLLRPDRYVAAVFDAATAPEVIAAIRDAIGRTAHSAVEHLAA